MTDSAVLWADCSKCGNRWYPFGNTLSILPQTADITCPECGHKESTTWYDSETAALELRKKRGLITDAGIRKELDELKSKVGLIESQIQVEIKQRELTDAKVKEWGDWAKKREKDFVDIETIAREMNEEQKMKEDGR